MNKLPVSKKVYADIRERIELALSHYPTSLAEAKRIVDDYLQQQERNSDDHMATIAFNMIKPELDRAIERSRKARERAARKKESQPALPDNADEERINEIISSMFAGLDLDNHECTDENIVCNIKPSRRERREKERKGKGIARKKWKSISSNSR